MLFFADNFFIVKILMRTSEQLIFFLILKWVNWDVFDSPRKLYHLRMLDTVTSFHGTKFQSTYVFRYRRLVVWNKIMKINPSLNSWNFNLSWLYYEKKFIEGRQYLKTYYMRFLKQTHKKFESSDEKFVTAFLSQSHESQISRISLWENKHRSPASH